MGAPTAPRSVQRRLRSRIALAICVLGTAAVGVTAAPAGALPINPGEVSSIAGNGTTSTVDGTGTGASFNGVRGVAVIGTDAFVGTTGSIRKVDLTTGAVTLLAGHASTTGCTNHATGSSVRFNSLFSVVTDGTWLYSTGSCTNDELRRTDPSTGATTTVAAVPNAAYAVYAADGNLYVTTGSAQRLDKVVPSTGVRTTVDTFSWSRRPYGIGSDATHLWVMTYNSSSDTGIDKVALSGYARTSFVGSTTNGTNAIVATADHLYVDGGSGSKIRRYRKADASSLTIAGNDTAAHADGPGVTARFTAIMAMAIDGDDLLVTDGGASQRLRRVTQETLPAPGAQPASVATSLAIGPGAAALVAGSGSSATTDGTGAAAALKGPRGVAVVGGFAYVGTTGAIRKVNLATGVTTTLAGHASTTGCVDATSPGDVRFDTVYGLATDGVALYSTGNCAGSEVRRTEIATGSTRTIASVANASYLSYGPADQLYVTTGSGQTLVQVDAVSGATSTLASFGSTRRPYGIATDATYAWVATYNSPSDTGIDRVTLANGAVTQLVPTAVNGTNTVVSAGDYLYLDAGAATAIRRYRKSDAAMVEVAGCACSSYVEDVGAAARFSNIMGMASTGSQLVVADTGANRLRRVTRVDPAAATFGGANPHCVCPGQPVDTNTGNMFHRFSDLALPARGPGLAWGRTYNAMGAAVDGPLGYGWTGPYAMAVVDDGVTGTRVVREEGGAEVRFSQTATGWAAPPGADATLVAGGGGTWTFTRDQRQVFGFDSAGKLTSIEDRNGETTTLTYSTGKLSTIAASGRTITLTWTGNRITGVSDGTRSVAYAYDGAGDLTSSTDVRGKVTTHTYDGSHRMLTMTDPEAGVVMTNVYDGSGRITSQTDANGEVMTFAYATGSGGGTTTTVTDARGNIDVYVYSTAGQLLSATEASGDPEVAVTTTTYDPLTGDPLTVTDPLGETTTMTWDAGHNMLTSTDPLSRVTTYTYNGLGLPLTVTGEDGVTTTMTYDGDGNLLTTSRPLVGTASTATTTLARANGSHPGDVTSVTDPNGKVTTMTYNGDGGVASVTNPEGDETTFGYDGLGRRTTTVSPRGNLGGATPADFTTTVAYDNADQPTSVTDPLGEVTATTYDDAGRVETVTDPNANVTSYAYDDTGRVTTITRPDTTTLLNAYDDVGNLVTQTDGAGQDTTYGYDALDRVILTTDPLGRETAFGYDDAGHRTSLTAEDGGVTSFDVDDAGQLVGIDYSSGGTTDVTFTYDDNGARATMVDGTGTTTYTRDSLGRLTSVQNGASATVGYTWDLGGRLTAIAYPGSVSVTRGHDDAGRLTSVTDWASRTTGFGYDADGNMTSIDYPNGVDTDIVVDRAGRTAGIDHHNGATTIAELDYTRDDKGLLATTAPTGVPGSAETYTYSDLDQLTGTGAASFAYDAADNLVTVGGRDQGFDVANQLCWSKASTSSGTCSSPPGSATTYSYDQRGNRTTITPPSPAAATSIGWDQANRMTSYGASATYAYDGDGLRASKTVSSVTSAMTWDVAGGLPELLDDGTNRYVQGPGGITIEQVAKAGGAATFLHHDQLGSARALTNTSGVATGARTYEPYGAVAGTTGSWTSPVGFAGEYTDAESGLVYLRARYLEPGTGQFMSRDRLIALTGDAYGYVGGSPLNGADPTGLCALGLFGKGCEESTAFQLVAHPGKSFEEGAKDRSVGVCVGGNLVSPWGGVVTSVCVVAAHGELGMTETATAGTDVKGFSAGGGIGVMSSNACSVEDLAGPFRTESVTVPWPVPIGVEHMVGDSSHGRVTVDTMSAGWGGGYYRGTTMTKTQVGGTARGCGCR